MAHERADLNHDVERVDVSTLSETQRDMLWMRLRRDDVAFVFDGHDVAVPESSGPLLADALTWVNTEVQSPPRGYYPPVRPLRRIFDDRSIASRWRRIAGAYIDSIVIGVPFASAHRLGLPSWALLPVSAFYVVGMTGLWGRTVGKLATGTKVVGVFGRPRLTWRQSVARWIEVGWIGIAAGLVGGDAAMLLFLLQAVAYAPVLWDPLGRGLHDRLADTIVIRWSRKW